MQYPQFIIDPLGQLFRFDSIKYNLVEGAPILKPQWLVGHEHALTEEGEVYDLINSRIVIIPGYEHLRFKEFIKDRSSTYNNEGLYNLQAFLIDTDDNLYQCAHEGSLAISHKIAEKVTHCFLNHYGIIYHTEDRGWFSRNNRIRRVRLPIDVSDFPPIDVSDFPPIDKVGEFFEDYFLTDNKIISIESIHKIEFIEGISDIIINYQDYGRGSFTLALINGVISISDIDKWRPINNPIVHELGELSPWIRFLHLQGEAIGALNVNGQLYSIVGEHINRFQIPPELLISHNTRKSATNKV